MVAPMVFQDVAFPTSRSSFTPHFIKIMVEVIVSGQAHLKSVVGVNKGMLPVKYVAPKNPLFVSVKFHCDH